MTVYEARARLQRNEPPPLFNKRLFKAQAGIVITDKILRVLRKSTRERRTAEDVHTVKAVVSALKDIHRGLQYIKEALCYVVTYEKIESDVEIRKKPEEKCLSCYYILTGSVEGKYTITNDQNGAVNRIRDCDISYTHVAGEFLGLVSGDGPQYDYPPPDSIRTTEVSEFLRIDREHFHQAVRRVQNQYVREIEAYVNEESFLKRLPIEEKTKLVRLMARQEYPAGKVILNQGDSSEHLFFVAQGRCQYYRSIYISEVGREEIVKLGQIEKGEFFGESTVIDSSRCFCSVASIGPVTCYLVNNWAIKTNEHLIQLLRENRRNFFQDSDIMYYIRDSDIWQSFKRDAIMKLVNSVRKPHMIVRKQDVPGPLARAVDYGDAQRCFSKPVRQDEMPGAPKPVDPLFIEVSRCRRRSSAILTSNTAAVVKAMLLLRRKSDVRTSTVNRSSPGVEFPSLNSNQNERKWMKPTSAPSRCRLRSRRSKSPMAEQRPQSVAGNRGTSHYRSKSRRSVSPFAQKRSKSTSNTDQAHRSASSSSESSRGGSDDKPRESRSNNRGSRSPPKDYRSHSPKRIKKTKKLRNDGNSVESQKFPAIVKGAPTPKQASLTSSSSDPLVSVEKIISAKPNFVVKEIINTGLPGRKSSPKSFRRFSPSMFEMLDKPNEKKPEWTGVNPWSLSRVAGKWLRTLKKERCTVGDREESGDDTSPTPIIVIEDWSPETKEENERTESPRAQMASSPSHRRGSRKMSRTPSPALNDVTEESEEDIKNYEEIVEAESAEERWYTEIHEARDLSYQQLTEMKKDIEEMERRRKKLDKTEESREELTQINTGLEKVATKEEVQKEKVVRARLVKSRSAKFSVKGDDWLEGDIRGRERRSRTFSGAIDIQKSPDSHSKTRRDRSQLHRTQSLGRVKRNSVAVEFVTYSLPKKNYKAEEEKEASKNTGSSSFVANIRRKATSKGERRRQLLLRKVLESQTCHHS